MLNLLDNAVKYSPGGVHVRCRIGIERYTTLVLSVADTGLGLPARDMRVGALIHRVLKQGDPSLLPKPLPEQQW